MHYLHTRGDLHELEDRGLKASSLPYSAVAWLLARVLSLPLLEPWLTK